MRYWIRRYAVGGIDALQDAPWSGRPARADAAYHQALEEAVTTPPPRLGLSFDVWTSGCLSASLAETTGVQIAPSWLRSLLIQHDYVYGRPKHTLHHLQDRSLTAACADLLAAVKKKVAQEPERYEMHFEDETHLETNPYVCKVWHRRGQQPTIPAAGANRRLTVFGSVDALGRGRVEVVCAAQDSAHFAYRSRKLEVSSRAPRPLHVAFVADTLLHIGSAAG